METIRTVASLMFIVLAAWMAVTIYCQIQAMRFVVPGHRWHYKKAVRKWQFEMARQFLQPEGQVWLQRVEKLLHGATVILGLAAFTAVGLMVFGPTLSNK